MLYQKSRPRVFDDLIGQSHVTRTLGNALRTGRLAHAFLFVGIRGTGKTSAARLLAKGVNCTASGERPCGECDACLAIERGRYLDLVEIAAASNTGGDHVRELRESVRYAPVEGQDKV